MWHETHPGDVDAHIQTVPRPNMVRALCHVLLSDTGMGSGRILQRSREFTKALPTDLRTIPLVDVVHGFPGAGKGAVLGWMRQSMEKGLGWVHGVLFCMLGV